MGLAVLSVIVVLLYILGSRFMGHYPSDLEKIYVAMFGLVSLLWARMEAINVSKIEYNDAIERIEKLYYDQCRFERAICEKFNVVYRQDEDGLETFYDKKEYFDREYQKAKESLAGEQNG